MVVSILPFYMNPVVIGALCSWMFLLCNSFPDVVIPISVLVHVPRYLNLNCLSFVSLL